MAKTRAGYAVLASLLVVAAGVSQALAHDLAGSGGALSSTQTLASTQVPSLARGRITFELGPTLRNASNDDRFRLRKPGWGSLMLIHSVSVVADLVSTRRAFDNGAVEANPLFGWAGQEGALTLRAATGFALSFSLNRMHTSDPRLARRILWSAILFNTAVSMHNHQLTR